MRGPEAPSGWPIAIAPPFGLTRLSPKSTSRPRRQAKTCAANASLISITSMSLSVRPARSSAFFAAGTGPKPMMRGSTPATPVERIRAIGRLPAGDDHRHRAVIDARGVAGGGDAVLEQGPQLGQCRHVGLRPRVFV